MSAALNGRADVAERLLAHDPALVDAGLDVALVLGDQEWVAAAVDRDPTLVSRELPGIGRRPLSCACHSVFLSPSSRRAPGVRRVVELLLDSGADVNEVHHNEYGAMSVLYGAAGVVHDPETTRLLLERGADPNDGEAVYHAVEADDTACLELLLRAGATVRDTNALANAIDDRGKVRILLEQGDLRASDPELRDALLYARAPAVVELLIEHRASLDARDRDGLTPYARAARFKSEEMMKLLEDAGADTTLDPAAAWIGAIVRGDHDRAARVKAGHPDLVVRDADLEQLARWASAGDDEVVARLLDAGVPLDARGIDGGTALHYAGLWGRGRTVALLLARGADTETWSAPGPTLGTGTSTARVSCSCRPRRAATSTQSFSAPPKRRSLYSSRSSSSRPTHEADRLPSGNRGKYFERCAQPSSSDGRLSPLANVASGGSTTWSWEPSADQRTTSTTLPLAAWRPAA